ncbi:MAG: outer membrane beta-barrel protein [Steroidobacteraceae bacterium]
MYRTAVPTAMALAALASSQVQAADNGVYLGAGISRSSFDLQQSLDRTDTGYKVIAGLRLLDSFGVEASYADHGNARLPSGVACVALVGAGCPDTAELRARTTAAFAVGFLDFPLLDLFGKAGLSYPDSSLRVRGMSAFGDHWSGVEFAWGAGAQAHLGSFAVRAEYERFKVFDNRKLESISASFIYTFL